MALLGVHQGIRDLFLSLHGLFNFAPPLMVNDTVANSTAIVPFANITQAAFNQTVNQTVKTLNETLADVASKGFLDKATDTTLNVLNWGYTTIGYAGSALQNLLYATDRSSFAVAKSSELGTDVLSVAKSLFVMTDALGLYLCNIYLQYGPETFAQIIKAAEQKINEDLSDPHKHPEGWGIATLILTAATVVLLINCINSLSKSKDQKNTEKLIATLAKMVELENTWSIKNIIGSTLKWTSMFFVGFSIASLVTPLFYVAVGAGIATPIVSLTMSTILDKITNKGSNKQTPHDLLKIVDALREQGANEVMLSLLQARALEAVRDPQAMSDSIKLYRLLNSGSSSSQSSNDDDPPVSVIRDLPGAMTFTKATAKSSSSSTAASLASKAVDKAEPVVKDDSPSDSSPKLSKSALKKEKQKMAKIQ